MKAILICPGRRPGVPLLAEDHPLATLPALGQGLVEYWMSHLACEGVKQAVILSSDRTEEVVKVVGNGSRWGVAAAVIDEARELAPEEAAQKYEGTASLMDHFPGLPAYPLFHGYDEWFRALKEWIPHARTPDRVGVREIRPGIWVGRHGHISHRAALHPPCWLGDHVYVGTGAVVGPNVILEKGAFVEPDAEIKSSFVGPATFVGRYVRLKDSLAWGNTVVDLPSLAETKVTDAFVLCSLQKKNEPGPAAPGLLDRFADLIGHWIIDEPMRQAPELVKR